MSEESFTASPNPYFPITTFSISKISGGVLCTKNDFGTKVCSKMLATGKK
ncbi:hypothetical protein [Thermoplasma sp.]|nr:hypothetical protein [Thermoplasma sp.]